MIELNNISIGYKSPIISNVNEKVNNGELVCLIGKNGSGKTTLLKSIARLNPVMGGDITIDSRHINLLSNSELATKVAILLTESIDIQHITVRQIIAFGLYPYYQNNVNLSAKDNVTIDSIIERTHLKDKENAYYNLLSDGEKQRTLYAKTLAQNTTNILLDEPTSHLDLPSKIDLLLDLKEWNKSEHKSILISIHEPELALHFADRIWLIHDHEIISGTPHEIAVSEAFRNDFLNKNISFDTEKLNFDFKERVLCD